MDDEQMAKALKELIDETITEIEDLKKSDRFSASEVKIEGPGEGLAGKPTNGELDASKADDKDEDKVDDKKEDKKEDSCEKGVLDEAEKSEKSEDDKEDDKKDDKKEDKDDKKEDKDDKKEDDKAPWMKSVEEVETLKKSVEAQEELMKSYIDSKIAPIESRMTDILTAIKEISDTPVERKSVPSDIQPLTKSVMDGPEPLNKSEVINKMFELKKSGTSVPTEDITRAELGSPADLDSFVTKYKLTRD